MAIHNLNQFFIYQPSTVAKDPVGTGPKPSEDGKNIHDFFAALFPPDPVRPPPRWKILSELFPFSEDLKDLEKEIDKNRFSERKILALCSQNESVETLCEILKNEVPFFAKAWSLANRVKKLQLSERPDDYFSKEHRMHEAGRGAEYHFTTHKIVINRSETSRDKIYSLFFETINAVQWQKFQKLHRFASQGILDREEYAFCKELIELWSFNLANRIYRPGFSQSISESWKSSNQPARAGLISHADEIRHAWDSDFGWNYLNLHPDLFSKPT